MLLPQNSFNQNANAGQPPAHCDVEKYIFEHFPSYNALACVLLYVCAMTESLYFLHIQNVLLVAMQPVSEAFLFSRMPFVIAENSQHHSSRE